ncbi:hypothetical protein BOTBODRAFT_32877 [Botryobasidium botryosum FD-172 SS1]|uniref:Nucleoside transporter n=1 Tax=Botryobasidium botryosum (strain FD-172 SS1) TaxID=930990 RepID=A0A067MEV8_BOTB1|nr:hypothetical protein BOTBODRAFT_32877 [Botryobasidium botryosum FD-172 SS1]
MPDVQPIDPRIRWVCFVLGASVLLPWNALINATPYFIGRLAGAPNLQSTFSSYLSASYTLLNTLTLGHATMTNQRVDSSKRIRSTVSFHAFLFALVTISPVIPFPSPSAFFFFVMLVTLLSAAICGYCQTAVYAVVSQFGPAASQAAMSGSAAISVVVSVVQYITALTTTLARESDIRNGSFTRAGGTEVSNISAVCFFGLSTAFLLSSLAAHAWLVKTPEYHAAMIAGSKRPEDTVVPNTRADGGETDWLLAGDPRTDMSELIPNTTATEEIIEVTKMNYRQNFAIAYVFIITLAIFPPITSSIQSVHTPPPSIFLTPLLFNYLHFFVYNFGDWTGRALCAYPRLVVLLDRPRVLLLLSLARTALIPLFLMCNIQRPIGDDGVSIIGSVLSQSNLIRVENTPIINSDLGYMAILAACGLSTGYISSLCVMSATSTAHNTRLKRDQVDLAATIVQFFLVGGVAVGSMLSFGVRGIVCQCNPFYE